MKDKAFIRALGLRVRTLRERQDLSQEELAHRAGLSALTVSKIELGAVDARIGTVHRLGRSLGLTTAEVLSDIETAQPDRQLRRLINEVVAHLGQHDLATVKVLKGIVEQAISLKTSVRRKR